MQKQYQSPILSTQIISLWDFASILHYKTNQRHSIQGKFTKGPQSHTYMDDLHSLPITVQPVNWTVHRSTQPSVSTNQWNESNHITQLNIYIYFKKNQQIWNNKTNTNKSLSFPDNLVMHFHKATTRNKDSHSKTVKKKILMYFLNRLNWKTGIADLWLTG